MKRPLRVFGTHVLTVDIIGLVGGRNTKTTALIAGAPFPFPLFRTFLPPLPFFPFFLFPLSGTNQGLRLQAYGVSQRTMILGRRLFFLPPPPSPFPSIALAPTLRVTMFTLPNLPPS